jgi:hypothetical protein
MAHHTETTPETAAASDLGSTAASDPRRVEASDAEVEAWAERERQRRKRWLEGPTAEERAAYARRHRDTRLLAIERDADDLSIRMRVPSPRDAMFVAEGAASLMWKWSQRQIANLERAGREWEEQMGESRRRGRVPLDDDSD